MVFTCRLPAPLSGNKPLIFLSKGAVERLSSKVLSLLQDVGGHGTQVHLSKLTPQYLNSAQNDVRRKTLETTTWGRFPKETVISPGHLEIPCSCLSHSPIYIFILGVTPTSSNNFFAFLGFVFTESVSVGFCNLQPKNLN